MRYKTYIQKISEALEVYRADIIVLAKQHLSEVEKMEQKVKNMAGKYTPEYIEQYKKEQRFSTDYKARMNEYRSKAESVVMHNLEIIEKQLNGFFNAPVSPDFANKINSIAITGLVLNDAEFKILQESASTYMEMRLLNQLAQSRTKEGHGVEIDEKGTPKYTEKKVSDPYLYLEVPDINVVMKAFEEYEQSAKYLLNNYSGENAELYSFLENGAEQFISITADAYFRTKHPEKFIEVMDKANSILPENKMKRKLTEQDIKFIDTIIDPKYPSLAKAAVKEIAEHSPDIGELLRLDPRYREFLEEE